MHKDALGPQDDVLYDLRPVAGGPPRASQFKPCTRRHSRFAIDTKEEAFPNGFAFGQRNVMEIPRRGDMLGNITLEIRLPDVPDAQTADAWIEGFAHVLMRRLDLIVDDTLVQTQERLWYDLSDRLFMSASHAAGMDEMVGKAKPLYLKDRRGARDADGKVAEPYRSACHTLYLPLKLLCCKSHHSNQNFLPLLGVPGSTITLALEAETFQNCVSSYGGTAPLSTLDIRVLIDYVFLDDPEKERLLRRPTSILFEDVQDMEARSYKEGNSEVGAYRTPLDRVDVDLSELNVPVKAFVWVSYLTNYGQFFEYTNDITTSTVLLSGQELIEPQSSEYFTLVDPYMHNLKVEGTGNVHLYSLALDVGGMQPSGHISFDQVHAPILRAHLSSKRPDLTVKVFAMCYKMLKIDKGRLAMQFV